MRKTEYYDFLLETRMAKATGKRMLFTGPDYIGDYRVRFVDFTRYIGNSTASPESTSELKYLYRAAPRSPAPLQKDCYVGGIGWGVPKYSSLNRRVLVNGNQIKRKEFWQACEDRLTHRYQNPWQPPPDILDVEGQRARSTLAWTHDQYDDYCHGKSKWSQQFWNKNIPDATPVNMFQDETTNQMPLPCEEME